MAKGVTKFIKIDEVRREIDSVYPNPGQDVEGELEVENNGYGHLLIGNAFEFLCKLFLYRECDEVIQPWGRRFGKLKRRWSGDEIPPIYVRKFDGMRWEDYDDISNRSEWEAKQENRPVWRRRQSAVKWTEDEELSKLAKQYVQTGMNTEGVVRAALVNAGWKPSDTVHSWINREAFEDDVLEEMESLFGQLRTQEWMNGDVVLEKPTFGKHLHILPGEGDFIIDDLLIDIKTTENRKFTRAFWRQILLYYVLVDIQRVLHDVEGRTYEKEPYDEKYPEVNRVGIYFARYGELKTVEMERVIDDIDRYEEFRAWIVDRAIQENEHAQHSYAAVREALTRSHDFKKQRSLFDDY